MKKSIEEQAADFLIPLEGFEPVAYWDYKAYSIGYGSQTVDGKPVLKGQVITREKARIVLLERLRSDIAKIKKAIVIPLNDNQVVALASFIYNVGPVGLTSSLFKSITLGASREVITAKFAEWRNAGGQVNPILVERRKKETIKFYS